MLFKLAAKVDRTTVQPPQTEIENSARTEKPHVNKTNSEWSESQTIPEIHENGP